MLSWLPAGDPTGWLLALLVLFVATILVYLMYSGLFTAISVDTLEPPYATMLFAYKTATGSYKGAGQLFTETYCLMPDKMAMGIYYDDPDATPAEECRYAVGCILSQEPAAASIEDIEKMLAEGYHLLHLPKPNYCVWVAFPFTTTLSILIAIFRVYPKLKQYIASRGLCAYPAVEIYEGSHINFMMPLSRQEEYFVPEFSDEELSVATTEASCASHTAAQEHHISRSSRALTASASSRAVSGDNEEISVAYAEVDSDGFLKPISIKKVENPAHPDDAQLDEGKSVPDEPSQSASESVHDDSSEFEDLSKEALN